MGGGASLGGGVQGIREAATHYERAAALSSAPAAKAQFAVNAALCNSKAEAM